MKKIGWILIVIAVVGGLVWYVAAQKKRERLENEKSTVRIEEVRRGDLTQSVQASGKVVSNLDVEIKCKASGEIIELPFDVSDVVEKGALVLQLDPTDEERNVRKAEAALKSSRARLEKAISELSISKQELENSKKKARVTLESLEVKVRDAQAKRDRTKQLFENKLASGEEYESAETSAAQALADFRQAQIRIDELKTEEQSLELRRQDVASARADVETNEISLGIARQRLNDTKVYAPVTGVITSRFVQTGQIIASGINNVGGGTSIMTISDLSKLYVLAAVDESDIGLVQAGQKVMISADAFPDRRFGGTVERIALKGENNANVVTFEVKIEVADGPPEAFARGAKRERGDGRRDSMRGGERSFGARPRAEGRDGKRIDKRPGPGGEAGARFAKGAKDSLKPEMTADVEIIISRRRNVLLAPSDAVSRMHGKQFVSIVGADEKGADEKIAQREVTVGINDGENTEITSGLKEGERVQIVETLIQSKWSGRGMRMMPMGGGPPHR